MDSEAMSQFVAVTGAAPDAAHFFLESANGNVEAAIDQYFTSGGQAQQEEPVSAPASSEVTSAPTANASATASAAPSLAANKPAAGQP